MGRAAGGAVPADLLPASRQTCILGLHRPWLQPIVIFFPIEMWIKTKRPRGAKLRWLRALNVAGLLVTLATTAGSLQLLITSWSDFQLFGSNVQTTGTLT